MRWGKSGAYVSVWVMHKTPWQTLHFQSFFAAKQFLTSLSCNEKTVPQTKMSSPSLKNVTFTTKNVIYLPKHVIFMLVFDSILKPSLKHKHRLNSHMYLWGVLVFPKFGQFSSELTKTWSSGATKCGVWIGNCNVKVWKSTEHKLHKIWRSLKFCVNSIKRAHPWFNPRTRQCRKLTGCMNVCQDPSQTSS